MMLEGEGVQQMDDESEGSSYVNATIGDDDGLKEYPFVTSSRVLSVMRKLYDLHKKQLVQDFINCACDYENCPKGSYLSKECKTSVPGPYYSCPILHDDGNDFFSLPLPRKSPRVSKPLQSFMRKPKKRTSCRKCSQVTFNHFDGAMYHENYLKEVTYAKYTCLSLLAPCYNTGGNSDEMASSGEQKYSDREEEAERSCHGEGWADLKELIDPWRPLKTAEDKEKKTSKGKKRGKSATKPVTSRYKEVSKRRSRPNINSMHVSSRLMSEVARTGTETDINQYEDKTGATNPFPMPDVFEEIYFGQMPESINSLPVSLQNFKKIQLKMAGENACLKTFDSYTKKNATSPPLSTNKSSNNVTSSIQVGLENLTMGVKGNSIGALLSNHSTSNINNSNRPLKLKKLVPPLLNIPSSSNTSVTNNDVINIKSPNSMKNDIKLEGGIRYLDSISHSIEKTVETTRGIQNHNEPNNNNTGKQQKTSMSFRKTVSSHSTRNIQTAGKKNNSTVLPSNRKITSRKLSTPINSVKKSSNHSMTRKNRSYALLRDHVYQREHGVGTKGKKRKKTTHRLTTAQIREEESTAIQDIKNSEASGKRLHNEVDNSFHDEDGTFNPTKYRESLINFIEKKEACANKININEDNSTPYYYDSETSNTSYKSNHFPTVNEATRTKTNEFKEKNTVCPTTTVTLYKSAQTHLVNSIPNLLSTVSLKGLSTSITNNNQPKRQAQPVTFSNISIRASQSTVQNKKNTVNNGNARPRTRSEMNTKNYGKSGKLRSSMIRDPKRIWIEATSHGKPLSDKSLNFSYPSSTSPNF